MNIVHLQGRVIKNAIRTGEGKLLKFLLSCSHRFEKDGVKQGLSTVPCTIFRPDKEIQDALMSKQTIYIECSGRISRSSFEAPDGEMHHSTEVIVDPVSIVIRKQ